MDTLLQESEKLEGELRQTRRWLHKNAEVGFALEKTENYVIKRLEEIGCKIERCGNSIVANIGKNTGRTVLLRADMDALPIQEKTGKAYACKTGHMHACGHDMHTTMLLGAAKLLKAREKELDGRVKLLFQPAEESLEGAKDAIAGGVLNGVDAAMAIHVATDTPFPTGTAIIASAGVSAPAADHFTIRVKGKGCHGGAPQNGVDALMAAAHILVALEEISARELAPTDVAVMTIGKMLAGEAGNAVADFAEASGTLRAKEEKVRSFLKKRLVEISSSVAKAFRASAKVQFSSGCPALVNDGAVADTAENIARAVLGEQAVMTSAELKGEARGMGGSEDFAYIAQKVPSVLISVAAGQTEKGYCYPLHHPKAIFDEGALKVGCALYAGFALGILP